MMLHTSISWQHTSLMQFSSGSVDYLYWPCYLLLRLLLSSYLNWAFYCEYVVIC